jgi:hypothetical protein
MSQSSNEIHEAARRLAQLLGKERGVTLETHWRVGQIASSVSVTYGDASIQRLCEEIKAQQPSCSLTPATVYKDLKLFQKLPEVWRDRARANGISYRQFVGVLSRPQEDILAALREIDKGSIPAKSFSSAVGRDAQHVRHRAHSLSCAVASFDSWASSVSDADLVAALPVLAALRSAVDRQIRKGKKNEKTFSTP